MSGVEARKGRIRKEKQERREELGKKRREIQGRREEARHEKQNKTKGKVKREE